MKIERRTLTKTKKEGIEKRKKKIVAFLVAALAVQMLTMPVSALYVGNAENEPEEDPNFVEMSLEDFLAENPDYVGDDEPVSTLTEIETTEGSYIWSKMGSYWYLYDPQGNPIKNDWFKDYSGHWYYLNSYGRMVTGWWQVGNYWYYFNAGGIMQTDWYQVGSKWYYLRTDAVNDSYPVGSAVTGAQYLPTTKGSTTRSRNYYFDYNCSMVEWTYPVSTSYVTLSSCFNDPRSGSGVNHQGIDIPAAGGTTIKSCSSGEVYKVSFHTSMGNYVTVTSDVKDANGNNLILRYMHMMQFPSASTGTSIAEGNIVGYVGSTGDSTGNHLHLDVNDQGLYSGIRVSSCVNPSSFFTSVTLKQGSLAEVPPYGLNYCYAR